MHLPKASPRESVLARLDDDLNGIISVCPTIARCVSGQVYLFDFDPSTPFVFGSYLVLSATQVRSQPFYKGTRRSNSNGRWNDRRRRRSIGAPLRHHTQTSRARPKNGACVARRRTTSQSITPQPSRRPPHHSEAGRRHASSRGRGGAAATARDDTRRDLGRRQLYNLNTSGEGAAAAKKRAAGVIALFTVAALLAAFVAESRSVESLSPRRYLRA